MDERAARGLRIAVSGKGGTGKTTIAAVLAHCFNNDGYRVLAVDADPDANLASALGIPPQRADAITPISARRELIKERTGADPAEFGQLFKMNPVVDDIPDEYAIDVDGIKMIVMGAVKKGGAGCACPESVLLRSLLSEIILNRDEVIIVDMEAGIEHLGRATAKAIDRMLIAVEPGMRSISTAKTIMRMAREIGITSFGVIGNKIMDPKQDAWVREELAPTQVVGMIRYSQRIMDADLKGLPLIDVLDKDLKAEFEKIYQACLSRP